MPVPNMTEAPTREVNSELAKLNKSRAYPLNNYQKRQIADAKPIYVYNVSTIHEWKKPQGQLGTLTIAKCSESAEVSEPLLIPGAVARWYDKGLGRKDVFIEDGREVAEDICGCSKEYPAENSNNNLTNFGVFLLDKPIDELDPEDRERIVAEANTKFVTKLRELMLVADNLYSGDKTRDFISNIHRAALTAFNSITGSAEKRPWAPVGNVKVIKKLDCIFCGASNNLGVVKCANCHEVIDAEGYAKLKKAAKG